MPRASDRDAHAELVSQVERREAERRDRRAVTRVDLGRRRTDVVEPSWFWWAYAVGFVGALLAFTAWDRWGGRELWHHVFD